MSLLSHLGSILGQRQAAPEEWLFFLLGLAAVSLLPIKRASAYRGVSLALAVLWAGTAYVLDVQLHASALWIALADLQSLVFLVLGAPWGRFRPLEFAARNGPWTVAGTVLIFYSLLVHPLLELFAVGPAEQAAAGIPLSLVLFSCGVLFFAVSRLADLALAVPLLWAFLGESAGPNTALGEAGLWELRSVLLAGALFILTPPALRHRTERRQSPGLAYRLAYRQRPLLGRGLWTLLLVSVFCLYLTVEEGSSTLGQVTVNLFLLSALGTALWLSFPAWQSLWFRYLAWQVARMGGRIWLWLQDGWKWGVLLLVLAVSVSWPRKEGAEGVVPIRIPKLTEWFDDHEIFFQLSLVSLVAALASWLAYRAYRGRKSVAITTFANHTGDEKLDKWVASLGTRLENELARIADLYQVIDEARPSVRGAVVEVTAGVQDDGEILKSASAISLGPLQVPVSFLLGLLGRIISRPRLTGALHKVDQEYVLTAELNGRAPRHWRVDFSKLKEEEKGLPWEAAVHKLVEQLAFRIATDLVSIGSPRWRAVRCFTEGLRLYRDAQVQKKDGGANLRQAELCLVQALNDDRRFTQCYYNLGVVYRKLGELGSAQSAFRRALEEDPKNLEACYALAEALVEDGKHQEAVRFCQAALGIDPADARAWDLQAYARRYGEQERASYRTALPPDHCVWNEVAELSEIAVALSWRKLCRNALRGPCPAVEREKATAFLCTRNLAVVLTRTSRHDESKRIFRQAARLAPHDPELRLVEARTLVWSESWQDAAVALEGIVDDGLETWQRGLLWGALAQAEVRSGVEPDRRDKARHAHRRFLDLAADASPKDLQAILDLGLETPRRPRDSSASGGRR